MEESSDDGVIPLVVGRGSIVAHCGTSSTCQTQWWRSLIKAVVPPEMRANSAGYTHNSAPVKISFLSSGRNIMSETGHFYRFCFPPFTGSRVLTFKVAASHRSHQMACGVEFNSITNQRMVGFVSNLHQIYFKVR